MLIKNCSVFCMVKIFVEGRIFNALAFWQTLVESMIVHKLEILSSCQYSLSAMLQILLNLIFVQNKNFTIFVSQNFNFYNQIFTLNLNFYNQMDTLTITCWITKSSFKKMPLLYYIIFLIWHNPHMYLSLLWYNNT